MIADPALLAPPAIVLMAGALIAPALPVRVRGAWLIALPLLALAIVWLVPDGPLWSFEFLDYRLTPWQVGPAGRLFATVFAIMAAAGTLYGLRQARQSELIAAQIYAGGAIGVCLSGDLITLFVYWEIMALASTVVIWANGGERAARASLRYIIMHLFGGVVLMAGIAGHVAATGSVAFGPLALDRVAHWLILAGFLLNAGAPPLSAWIPDAYPEASPSGTVFLSAFTTKTAVFVLWVAFPGATVLVGLGLYMIFYGIIYALLENDMRRILAYSIVNQVGFMVAGIGIGTEMALNGAAAHAFTHIIYKALLLMSAGAVLHMTGRRKCSELGGLFQSMPLTTVCGIIGALAISAFPLTSGFISKSMISQAAADQALAAVWFLLAAASAGVFLHAGIKFPWFVFFQRDSGLRPPDPPGNMRAAMVLFAFLCIALGIYPAPLYAILPFPVDYIPYTGDHVVTQLQLLLFAGLAFFALLPLMRRTETVSLDTDWFYRRLAPALGRALEPVGQLLDQRARGLLAVWQRSRLHRSLSSAIRSPWESRASIGQIVLLTTLVLLCYLILTLH